MNFLAHLFLSGSSERIMVGNFITDFMKGTSRVYSGKIEKGILLHRQIDAFTDRHQRVARSKKRLWQNHRHYSAVIVDLIYDHYLARNWHEYSNIKLEEFADHSYSVLSRHQELMPRKAANLLTRMSSSNWLVNYREIEGIDKALRGVASRTTFRSSMATAGIDLRRDYSAFEEDFRSFFPELIELSERFLTSRLPERKTA